MSGNIEPETVESKSEQEAVDIDSESYRTMGVREQAEVLESVEQTDSQEVFGVEATPEDYILGHVQADVELEDESNEEEEVSIQEVAEAREEMREQSSQEYSDRFDFESSEGGVSTPEKILGRTLGETYVVMGEGLPMGALVQFEIITGGSSYEESNASGGSALAKNDISDVHVKGRITMIEGRQNLETVTEGDLDAEDTREADGVWSFCGPGQIIVGDEPLLDYIPNNANWYAE